MRLPKTFDLIRSIALLTAAGLPLLGADTITINVPARAPIVPVARVVITMDLDADPSGASITYLTKTLTLGGVGTVDAGNVDGDATKDFIAFKNVGGASNTVQIFLTLISKMNAPADLCTLKVGPPEASTHTITLTTGQNVNTYRANFYTVASDSQVCANAVVKGQATRRIKAAASAVTVAGGGTRTFLGRNPFDIALVLDKSGSMLDTPPGGGPDSKWTILQQAVGQFASLWGLAEPPPPPLGGGTSPNDRMAAIFFSSNVVPVNAAGVSYVSRGAGANPFQSIIDTVNGTAAGGSTGMGAGMQVALDTKPTTSDLTMVLMTDGMQNVPLPQVIRNPADPANPAAALQIGDAPGTASLASNGVPVLTIGVGAPAGIDGDRLDTIAKQTAGTIKISLDNVGMLNAFTGALVDSLKGNTLNLYSRTVGTVTTGQSAPGIVFTVDKSVKRFIAELVVLEGGSERMVVVDAMPPGGGAAVPPTEVRSGNARFRDQAYQGPALGDWQIVVSASAFARSVVTPMKYQLSLYTADEDLGYRIAVSNPVAGTGDNLTLMAEVTYDGVPLTGLAGGITARVQRPGESLGTLLHNAGFDPAAPNPDMANPAQQKINQLLKDPRNVGLLDPQALPGTLTLHDDGLNGDAKAGDGIYTVTFPDTNKAGLYRFAVNMDWDTPQTGKVKRQESTERVIRLSPDATNSQIVTTAIAGSPGSFQVAITPRDRFGNYLGPGYQDVIVVNPTNGRVAGPPTDTQQTGTYTYRVDNVPAGAQPILNVSVDGASITSVAPVGTGIPWWVWLLLVLLLLLILIWRMLKK